MFSTVLSLSLHCLMNAVILSREQVMFFWHHYPDICLNQKEIGQKLLFHSSGSAGWLAE